MNSAIRFIAWMWHSIPLYSWRRCCVEWQKGRDAMQAELGLARDGRGRFVSLHPKQHSPSAMITVSRGVTPPHSKARSESSGQGDLFPA